MMPHDYSSRLRPAEIEQVVRYLLTLVEAPNAPPRTGAPPPLVGELAPAEIGRVAQPNDLLHGQALYERHCAMCHGDQGKGDMGSGLAGALASVNPLGYIRAATAQGIPGSMMPAWDAASGGPLSTADLDDLAAFVVRLVLR